MLHAGRQTRIWKRSSRTGGLVCPEMWAPSLPSCIRKSGMLKRTVISYPGALGLHVTCSAGAAWPSGSLNRCWRAWQVRTPHSSHMRGLRTNREREAHPGAAEVRVARSKVEAKVSASCCPGCGDQPCVFTSLQCVLEARPRLFPGCASNYQHACSVTSALAGCYGHCTSAMRSTYDRPATWCLGGSWLQPVLNNQASDVQLTPDAETEKAHQRIQSWY